MNDLGNIVVTPAERESVDLDNASLNPLSATSLQPHPTLWQFRVTPALRVLDTRRPNTCSGNSGGLFVVDGRLTTRDRVTATRIEDLVSRVQSADSPNTAYTIAPSNEELIAIKAELIDDDILISVLDFNAEIDIHIVALIDLFDLTAAEIRLTQDLISGLSLKAIAAKQGISTNTVRAHLKSTFLKTKTNRQADLIKMATLLSVSF